MFMLQNFFCVATGHGKDQEGYFNKQLQRSSQLKIWNREDCEATFNSEYFQKNYSLTWKSDPSFLCAGGDENVDTCEGDGGGPLVCLVGKDYNVVFDGNVDQEDETADDYEYENDVGDTELDLREDNNDKDSNDDDNGSNDDIDVFDYDFDENDSNDVDISNHDEDDDTDLELREDGKGLNGTYLVQVGIIAWGFECGKEGIPSVYSNLIAARGRCWLDQIMSCYKVILIIQTLQFFY